MSVAKAVPSRSRNTLVCPLHIAGDTSPERLLHEIIYQSHSTCATSHFSSTDRTFHTVSWLAFAGCLWKR